MPERTLSGVRQVRIHLDLLHEILEDREAAAAGGGMEGVHAHVGGVGHRHRDPVPADVQLLCNLCS